jgi:hypothetical protein
MCISLRAHSGTGGGPGVTDEDKLTPAQRLIADTLKDSAAFAGIQGALETPIGSFG